MKFRFRLLGFSVLCVILALFAGCGNESESPSSDAVPASEPGAIQSAPPAGSQSGPSAQEIVSDRTIDYIQGLVERGAHDRARQALADLATKQLTPQQQRRVQALQAKLPAN
jgi:outer membrane PBP1 activator LpoA protein